MAFKERVFSESCLKFKPESNFLRRKKIVLEEYYAKLKASLDSMQVEKQSTS